jgi:hypothetical protein
VAKGFEENQWDISHYHKHDSLYQENESQRDKKKTRNERDRIEVNELIHLFQDQKEQLR